MALSLIVGIPSGRVFPLDLGIYPLPFKMHVSERFSDFNSRHCDEIMIVQESVLLHSYMDSLRLSIDHSK